MEAPLDTELTFVSELGDILTTHCPDEDDEICFSLFSADENSTISFTLSLDKTKELVKFLEAHVKNAEMS